MCAGIHGNLSYFWWSILVVLGLYTYFLFSYIQFRLTFSTKLAILYTFYIHTLYVGLRKYIPISATSRRRLKVFQTSPDGSEVTFLVCKVRRFVPRTINGCSVCNNHCNKRNNVYDASLPVERIDGCASHMWVSTPFVYGVAKQIRLFKSELTSAN